MNSDYYLSLSLNFGALVVNHEAIDWRGPADVGRLGSIGEVVFHGEVVELENPLDGESGEVEGIVSADINVFTVLEDVKKFTQVLSYPLLFFATCNQLHCLYQPLFRKLSQLEQFLHEDGEDKIDKVIGLDRDDYFDDVDIPEASIEEILQIPHDPILVPVLHVDVPADAAIEELRPVGEVLDVPLAPLAPDPFQEPPLLDLVLRHHLAELMALLKLVDEEEDRLLVSVDRTVRLYYDLELLVYQVRLLPHRGDCSLGGLLHQPRLVRELGWLAAGGNKAVALVHPVVELLDEVVRCLLARHVVHRHHLLGVVQQRHLPQRDFLQLLRVVAHEDRDLEVVLEESHLVGQNAEAHQKFVQPKAKFGEVLLVAQEAHVVLVDFQLVHLHSLRLYEPAEYCLIRADGMIAVAVASVRSDLIPFDDAFRLGESLHEAESVLVVYEEEEAGEPLEEEPCVGFAIDIEHVDLLGSQLEQGYGMALQEGFEDTKNNSCIVYITYELDLYPSFGWEVMVKNLSVVVLDHSGLQKGLN